MALFLLLVIMGVRSTEVTSHHHMYVAEKISGSKILSWIKEERTIQSAQVMECARACRSDDQCVSFIHNRETQDCALLFLGMHRHDKPLISSSLDRGYQYYKMNGRGRRVIDCYDLLLDGYNKSGIYYISHPGYPQTIYCDQDTDGGGWLVFQRRQDGSEDFYRGWDDYEQGFGNLSGEFWIGNTFLSMLTRHRSYTLRVDMENFENETRYASYASFVVGDKSTKYRLDVGGYSGTAGDSLKQQNGMKFTTKDQDNDPYAANCAVMYKGAWWYKSCHYSNLNGLYLRGSHQSFANGINWYTWMGVHYSLKTTEMKLRPSMN